MKSKVMKKENLLPEWSHKVDVDDIGTTPVRTTISASPQERKDLARRLKVDSVDLLEARLMMRRERGNMLLHVQGDLKAQVTQPCVVTLEPVTQTIESAVEGWYANPESVVSLARARHERRSRVADAELPMLEEKEDPEPIIDGAIDLGELVSQHLALAIDPYPHKEGTAFERGDEEEMARIPSEARQNPFAALKDWKAGKNQEE